MTTINMGHAAEWYASNGFPVFPLHTPIGAGKCSCGKPCGNNIGKHPRTQRGFLEATTDLKIIANWWRRSPDANIGIPTGASTRTLVLDKDPRNGGDDSLELLISKYGPFPDSARQVTGGGGAHDVFRFAGGAVPASLAPGIDLKADAGYIVVAPSLHKSGRRYQWDGMAGKTALLNLAEVPDWLLNEIRRLNESKPNNPVVLPLKIRKGTQHHTLYAHACRLRNTGMEFNEIEAALIEVNKRCEEPGTVAYIRGLATSACRFAPGKWLLTQTPPQRSNFPTSHHLRKPLPLSSEVLASPIVLLVGTEREAETLRSYGFQAITNRLVSRPEQIENLRGKEVILLAGKDPTWRRDVIATARTLLGEATKIIVIELHGCENVTNWFGLGHSEAELIGEIEGSR